MPSQYDNRDLTGQSLYHAKDMGGLVIEGLCLSQEIPNSEVLPPDLECTFVDCNLDNVLIPPGVTMIRCRNRLYQVQSDGSDWIIDPETYEPIEPLNPMDYMLYGLSMHPDDLPDETLPEPATVVAQRTLEARPLSEVKQEYITLRKLQEQHNVPVLADVLEQKAELEVASVVEEVK